MSDHLKRIREHMAAETKAMLLDAERARLFDHHGNRGSEAEHSILRWMRARFAPDYTVSSGEVIDSFDTNAELDSRQQDGILHANSADANRFLLPSGMRLLPIETVAAVVEVKLTLSKEEFEKANAAAEETARLRLRPGRLGTIATSDVFGNRRESCPPDAPTNGVEVLAPAFHSQPPVTFALFAFGGTANVETIRGWMDGKTISLVCCLSAGCVACNLVGLHVPREFQEHVGAGDSLWHFSETLVRATQNHSRVMKHFKADFDAYAPYEVASGDRPRAP